MAPATTTLTPRERSREDHSAPWLHVDYALVGSAVLLGLLGLLMIYSATRTRLGTDLVSRQAMFYVVGLGLMAGATLFDYRRLREWTPVIWVGTVIMLGLVVSPLGSEAKGAQAWFEVGPLRLQPSEFAKVAVIVVLAFAAANTPERLPFKRLVAMLALAGVPMALIMLQPDLGTTLVFGAILIGMLVIAGATPRQLIVLGVAAVTAVVLVLNMGVLKEYQRDRLTAFLNQEGDSGGSTYNLEQSKIAIGSGGLVGKGLFEGTQTKLDYVPEQETDFIFTAVGEELGLLGGTLVLALYAVLAFRVWRTAQLAADQLGTLICAGVLAMLVFQVFQNVGMTMGIMPITGIPLPLLSYGGSSLMATFLALGLVLNVHMRRFR